MPDIASPEMYRRVFTVSGEGAKVLEDLVARFHDRRTYVSGGLEGQRETERRAAQKEVVGYILSRLGQIEEGENE